MFTELQIAYGLIVPFIIIFLFICTCFWHHSSKQQRSQAWQSRPALLLAICSRQCTLQSSQFVINMWIERSSFEKTGNHSNPITVSAIFTKLCTKLRIISLPKVMDSGCIWPTLQIALKSLKMSVPYIYVENSWCIIIRLNQHKTFRSHVVFSQCHVKPFLDEKVPASGKLVARHRLLTSKCQVNETFHHGNAPFCFAKSWTRKVTISHIHALKKRKTYCGILTANSSAISQQQDSFSIWIIVLRLRIPIFYGKLDTTQLLPNRWSLTQFVCQHIGSSPHPRSYTGHGPSTLHAVLSATARERSSLDKTKRVAHSAGAPFFLSRRERSFAVGGGTACRACALCTFGSVAVTVFCGRRCGGASRYRFSFYPRKNETKYQTGQLQIQPCALLHICLI